MKNIFIINSIGIICVLAILFFVKNDVVLLIADTFIVSVCIAYTLATLKTIID